MEEESVSNKMDTAICSEFDRLLDKYEDKHGGVYFNADHAYVEYFHMAMVYTILPEIFDRGVEPMKAVDNWMRTKAKDDFEDVLELMQ